MNFQKFKDGESMMDYINHRLNYRFDRIQNKSVFSIIEERVQSNYDKQKDFYKKKRKLQHQHVQKVKFDLILNYYFF